MGIGAPGAGKTTFLKSFAEKYSYDYICPDDIRLELTGNSKDQSRNEEAWNIAYGAVGKLISKGKNVVFDATFAKISDRIRFIKFAKAVGAEKIQGIFLDVPLEVTKERNANRERTIPEYAVERLHRQLSENPPKIEDGFDSIFTLDEYQRLIDTEIAEKFKGPKII